MSTVSAAPRPGHPTASTPAQTEGALAELASLLADETARMETRRRELARVSELLRVVSTAPGSAAAGAWEPLLPDLAAPTVATLIARVEGETRNLVMLLDEGPALDEATMRENQERMRAGLVQRTLYPAAVLDSPSSVLWVQAWSAIGEVQRLLPVAATEFCVFGDEAVVALAQWGVPDAGYVMSRDPLLVRLHAAYFDQLWDHAQPLAAALGDHKDDDRLLELMSLGLKDEAIARLMGLGLRTIRRRIAAIMALHGVDTRYQLGLSVGRREAR